MDDVWLELDRRLVGRWLEEAGLGEVETTCVGEGAAAERGGARVIVFLARGVRR